ncbi:hypothetical protein AA0119_g7457 [Alternaria tenuissima]|uniref:Uncharacterized protein n=1 Tax=Alternaria tenuissima TaxID=119927 RepID=A0AB37W8Z6_9PLEO|nr:uncharacterized protein J4E82_011088 [Alternaria postmessia]KAI5366810.1 hypothetical protein J4E82_011088 [Alternaria postmessia]RYN19882.1 hypothetical protein AA0115_g10489 [Alternaria tenuissima]RYN97363.1 hypothetical protein AA0119_g7457 [Alternaria tenuissima]RYO20988.1 hypothetical protein AA0121_g3328 [Alternaria tenuissima]
MKFTTPILLLALGVSVQAECYIESGFGTTGDKDCCWGGDQGADACLRQRGGIACTQVGNAESGNFCINMGIPTEKCSADCCDIKTGNGQPCPKGKNRCDKDSGCPYRDANGNLRS